MSAKTPHESAHVFPGIKEDDSVKGFQRVWAHLLDMVGIANLKIHDIRHAYASIGASQRLELFMIGELLGYAHQATTQRYSRLMDDPM